MEFIDNISNDEINNLPVKYFEGNIIIIDNFQTLEEEINNLKKALILGFDTETKPTFKKGEKNLNQVALLQLATETTAYLIRLNKIGLSNELVEILANKNIKKIGVATNDDIKALNKLNKFIPKGFIDLAEYSKEYNIEANGLRKLTGIILNFRISKSQQLSNWENDILTASQLKYAATDAWACIKIYNTLSKREIKQ